MYKVHITNRREGKTFMEQTLLFIIIVYGNVLFITYPCVAL